MKDFKKVIKKGSELLEGIIADYTKNIEEAYIKAGDDSFQVNLSLKFSPVGEKIKVKADIGFVESKVKDSAEAFVSDQQELPLKEKDHGKE